MTSIFAGGLWGRTGRPPRAISLGGRFAFNDCGETANTQIALLDYQPAPVICEIRNVRAAPGADAMGNFRGRHSGVLIECEGGYFAGDASGGALFDNQDKKIRDLPDDGSYGRLETDPSVQLRRGGSEPESRRPGRRGLAGTLLGRLLPCGQHLLPARQRVSARGHPGDVRGNRELLDAFERCSEYLRQNGVGLGATPAVLGPWVTYDSKQERFVSDFAGQANELSQRHYRQPFAVPEIG